MDVGRPIRKFRVEKSNYPDDKGTHILVMESKSAHGFGLGRVFKGTRQECIEKKKEMEEKYGTKR